MADDYKQMWTDLGLNVEAHDGLLAVLSDAYKDIYLSQPNRPAGMAYFDFVISEVHGLRIVELLKDKIAERYLSINRACFTPNDERFSDIKTMAKDLRANGVIHYALQFCTPYLVEAFRAKNVVEEAGWPFLRIETDYSVEDVGQLKTRIEAFIEMIKDGNRV